MLSALGTKPKLPKQLAQETKLRIVHVSRALREMRERDLVECLTPAAKSRGRLYDLTETGSTLLSYMKDSGKRFVLPSSLSGASSSFVRKVHGATLYQALLYIGRIKGEAAVREALKDWSVNLAGLGEDTWISVDAFDEYLELLEGNFGDGSYEFIRDLYSNAIPSTPSVREQVLRLIPLEALAERAPIVYNKEWNYGRLEVKVFKGGARFLHFDWMPTPAMCAVFYGTYEGVLKARGVKGRVTKLRCVRLGDDHCEYMVEWGPVH